MRTMKQKTDDGMRKTPGKGREKKMKQSGKIIILLILAAGFYCPGSEIKMIPLYIGPEKFVVEISDTMEKQRLGLMYRQFIPDNYGMLFVYHHEEFRGFWMKNCLVNLDIIYLDRNKQIINIHTAVPPCKNDPCKTYASERPAQYVLELRANRSKELNLKPGDTIFFTLKR